MAITDYATAREAVRAGRDPVEVAADLVATMTPYERLWCLDGDAPTWAGLTYLTGDDGYHRLPFTAARNDRLGIPGIAFADGPRGAVVGNATAFPVTMARGATWDPDLEERVGRAIGAELRALGATLTGAVCVNVLRHPAWGRAQETYGEDPFLVGEMGAALTRGLQEHVMACVKHFACNSMENARFTVDVIVDEVALHEAYLPHFRRIVDEGVASVMSAYNSVNGEWCGQNRDLLTGVLREEWGFAGFVISDWIFGLRDAATSVRAGLDIEMPYRMVRQQHLEAALADGAVTWAEVDAAAVRIVSTLLRFDGVLSAPAPSTAVVGSDGHRALAHEVAARSIVLLRNEDVDGRPVLPFDTGATVAVIGPLADAVNLGDGGSSDVWDLDCRTVLDGLRRVAGAVVHDDGSDTGSAAAVAASADVAVVVVGFTFRDEGEYIGESNPVLASMFPAADEPDVVDLYAAARSAAVPTEKPPRLAQRPRGFSTGGDRSSLRLSATDVALIRAVAAANPRTVVAVQAGSAVVVSEWIDDVPAVLQSWYGGCRAGDALADLLVGTVEPSGRLPFSVPVDEADLPVFDRDATQFTYDRWFGWWHLARAGRAPLFAFGSGLAYTSFGLADAAVVRDADRLVVTATVANTGDRPGSDVVQVYADLPYDDRPARLVGFARVDVAAGDRVEVTIEVGLDRLAVRDPATHTWVAPTGRHTIRVARHAGDPAAIAVVLDL